ncbi:MAG: carboxypeptidase-like regulatory domain-containing protein [Deltaproteobacteria bacterium]|nr:carboxypeptidase-like regulatory domain-containing protein [Deltaproteobacteria bacterium]
MIDFAVSRSPSQTKEISKLIALVTSSSFKELIKCPELKKVGKCLLNIQNLLITIINLLRKSKIDQDQLYEALCTVNMIMQRLSDIVEKALAGGFDASLLNAVDSEIKKLERIAVPTVAHIKINQLLQRLCSEIFQMERGLKQLDDQAEQLKTCKVEEISRIILQGQVVDWSGSPLPKVEVSAGILGVYLTNASGMYAVQVPPGFRYFLCLFTLSHPLFYTGLAKHSVCDLSFTINHNAN